MSLDGVNRSRITAVSIVLPLLASCVSDEEYRETAATEREVEDIREELEDIPNRTPAQEDQLARARALEASLEARLARAEQFTRDAWVQRGLEAGRRGLLTDWDGLLGMLGALVTGGAGLLVIDKRAKKRDAEDAARLKAEQEARLAEVMRQRDESREAQGIAGASKRSAAQAQSPVAQAVLHRVPYGPGEWTASPVPRTTTNIEELSAALAKALAGEVGRN